MAETAHLGAQSQERARSREDGDVVRNGLKKDDDDLLGRKRLDSKARPKEWSRGAQMARNEGRLRMPSKGVLGPGQGVPFEETQRAELERMCDQAHRLATVYNDTEGAIKAYNEVLRLDETHVRALANLGALYHREGDFSNARILYSRALQIRPDRSKTTYNLGRLEHECSDYDAARHMYETALMLECDDSTTCNALAYLGLLQQDVYNDFEKAINCYAHSLSISPNHVRTLDHKCALLVHCDQFQEAKELHRLVCQLEGSHTATWCPYMDSLFNGDLWQCHCSKRADDLERGSESPNAAEGKRPWMKKIQSLLSRKATSGPKEPARRKMSASGPSSSPSRSAAVNGDATAAALAALTVDGDGGRGKGGGKGARFYFYERPPALDHTVSMHSFGAPPRAGGVLRAADAGAVNGTAGPVRDHSQRGLKSKGVEVTSEIWEAGLRELHASGGGGGGGSGNGAGGLRQVGACRVGRSDALDTV